MLFINLIGKSQKKWGEIGENRECRTIAKNYSLYVYFQDFSREVVVCLESWLGTIRQVRSTVRVQFQDGSICALPDTQAEKLNDPMDRRDPVCKRTSSYVRRAD